MLAAAGVEHVPGLNRVLLRLTAALPGPCGAQPPHMGQGLALGLGWWVFD